MATIRKRGSRYHAQVRRSGFPSQTQSFSTRKLADEWVRATETKMDQGLFTDLSNAKQTTFGELLSSYLTDVTSKRRKEPSRKVERTTIKRIIRDEPELCAVKMHKLKPEHFERFKERRKNTPSPYKKREDGTPAPIADSTVNRELSILKCVIDKYSRRLGLSYNPANGRDVKRPTVNDERDFLLSTDEYQLILEECYKLRNKLIGPCLEVLFGTGARRSEIISLLWADVDLDIGTIILRDVKNTKNPDKIEHRAIGLLPRAIEVLRELPRTDVRVFPMSVNAYKCCFRRARKNAATRNPRVKQFRTHDARHDFTTKLAKAGWPAYKIMAQTGHRDPRSLRRYTNLEASYLAEELAKL